MFKKSDPYDRDIIENRVCAFVFFLSFPLAIPWIVKTADYKTSPVVQSRFKVGLAILALTIIATTLEYVLRSHDSNILKIIYTIAGIPVASLVLTELILMHSWKREFNDFRRACPTNATSNYCDRLYRKMKCNTTSVFPINKTVIVDGRSVNHTVEEKRLTPDTCSGDAREWMRFKVTIPWAYLYIIMSSIFHILALYFAIVLAMESCSSSGKSHSNNTIDSPINVAAEVKDSPHVDEIDPGDL